MPPSDAPSPGRLARMLQEISTQEVLPIPEIPTRPGLLESRGLGASWITEDIIRTAVDLQNQEVASLYQEASRRQAWKTWFELCGAGVDEVIRWSARDCWLPREIFALLRHCYIPASPGHVRMVWREGRKNYGGVANIAPERAEAIYARLDRALGLPGGEETPPPAEPSDTQTAESRGL